MWRLARAQLAPPPALGRASVGRSRPAARWHGTIEGWADEGPVAALPCSGNGAIAEIHKERGTAMMAMQRKVERKRAACATKIQACERGRRARLLGAGQAMKPATREAERAVGA